MDDKHGRLAAALQAAKSEGRRSNDSDNKRRKKKQSQIMYKRRKIEKEIKKLMKRNPIKYKEVLEIHERYGI